jgi:hypothetical protein
MPSTLMPTQWTESGEKPIVPEEISEHFAAHRPDETSILREWRSARPDHLLLGTVGDDRLRVLKPIPLDVSVEDVHVVVSWTEVDEFGSGDTLSQAIDDFSASLLQLRDHLLQAVSLGPDLQRVQSIVNEYVGPRSF